MAFELPVPSPLPILQFGGFERDRLARQTQLEVAKYQAIENMAQIIPDAMVKFDAILEKRHSSRALAELAYNQLLKPTEIVNEKVLSAQAPDLLKKVGQKVKVDGEERVYTAADAGLDFRERERASLWAQAKAIGRDPEMFRTLYQSRRDELKDADRLKAEQQLENLKFEHQKALKGIQAGLEKQAEGEKKAGAAADKQRDADMRRLQDLEDKTLYRRGAEGKALDPDEMAKLVAERDALRTKLKLDPGAPAPQPPFPPPPTGMAYVHYIDAKGNRIRKLIKKSEEKNYLLVPRMMAGP